MCGECSRCAQWLAALGAQQHNKTLQKKRRTSFCSRVWCGACSWASARYQVALVSVALSQHEYFIDRTSLCLRGREWRRVGGGKQRTKAAAGCCELQRPGARRRGAGCGKRDTWRFFIILQAPISGHYAFFASAGLDICGVCLRGDVEGHLGGLETRARDILAKAQLEVRQPFQATFSFLSSCHAGWRSRRCICFENDSNCRDSSSWADVRGRNNRTRCVLSSDKQLQTGS